MNDRGANPRELGIIVFIWILAISASSFSNVDELIAKMADEDDKFVTVYGNDFETSGIWHRLRDICKINSSSYMTSIENICSQAHDKAGKMEGDINIALIFTRELIFHDSEKYKPIKLDIICYIVVGLGRADGTPYYFYLTKGLQPNCVYYLKPFSKNDTGRLWLDEHVCGIVI